jgi:hypothetical protein
MKPVQIGKAKLVTLGTWLAEDPRRLTIIVTLITVLVAAVAVTTGLPHTAILVGPNSDGGGGGGG